MDISKKLLSEVLGTKVYRVSIENDDLIYTKKEFGIQGFKHSKVIERINIDTIGRFCKEYLKSQGYVVTTTNHMDTVAVSLTAGIHKYSTPAMTVYTELEAILHATEWAITQRKH